MRSPDAVGLPLVEFSSGGQIQGSAPRKIIFDEVLSESNW